MNCYDGCRFAKIEINHVVCHCLEEPLWVNKPYCGCKYFESRSVSEEIDEVKIEKDVK